MRSLDFLQMVCKRLVSRFSDKAASTNPLVGQFKAGKKKDKHVFDRLRVGPYTENL